MLLAPEDKLEYLCKTKQSGDAGPAERPAVCLPPFTWQLRGAFPRLRRIFLDAMLDVVVALLCLQLEMSPLHGLKNCQSRLKDLGSSHIGPRLHIVKL